MATKRKRPAAALTELLRIMARLRAPDGCPWDREQNHRTLRRHAIEEVYELIDAIEAGDDAEMADELGDLLLQVVFHCQLAAERGAFDFGGVCGRLVAKLIRRHPHVFGEARADTSAAVWAQWDRIKQEEKAGTRHERRSVFDGIPRHLPALMRAEKVSRKARQAGLWTEGIERGNRRITRGGLSRALMELAAEAQRHGWSAEQLLRAELNRRERQLRRREAKG